MQTSTKGSGLMVAREMFLVRNFVAPGKRGEASKGSVLMPADVLRTANAAALYEGLSGETLKGFFSHGISIITTNTVHRAIIQPTILVLCFRIIIQAQKKATKAEEQSK